MQNSRLSFASNFILAESSQLRSSQPRKAPKPLAVIVRKIQLDKIDNSMDYKLLKYFLKIQPLLENEIEAIDETMVIKHFKKGTVLLKEGQTQLMHILF